MTTPLEHVRTSCGMAGEEVAEMVDALEAKNLLLIRLIEDMCEATVPYLPNGEPMWSDELTARINKALK